MAKNLHNFTILSKFTSKNAKILCTTSLGREFHCLIFLTKKECKKQFILANGCLNLNNDLILFYYNN